MRETAIRKQKEFPLGDSFQNRSAATQTILP